MSQEIQFVRTEGGLNLLADYLKGPRDRQHTLSATWPVALGAIKDPRELQVDLPEGLRAMKRISGELEPEEIAVFKEKNPFASLVRQFEAVAKELCEFVDAPEFAIDYFWCRSTVQPGQTQFIRWHNDGDITVVDKDGSSYEATNNESYPPLVKGAEFYPNAIYLQATLVLPTIFASQIQNDFDPNVLGSARQGKSLIPVLNEPKLKAWLAENATLTRAPAGHIIAFPSGVIHTGAEASEELTRTLVVARLRIKPRAQEYHA